ncbi:MAG: phosphatase PAP2 family protein [Candidatus Kapabacteria bacterium]|nr:phosphatase PAP2 family protein [Candidatus Kapabacteria bacterium]
MTNDTVTTFRTLLQTLRANVLAYDIYAAVTLSVYVVLAVLFYPKVDDASAIILTDLLIAVTVASVIVLNAMVPSPIILAVRRFYTVPVVYLMYEQVQAFVHIVHPRDYDDLLIAADRALFGTDPTVWLGQIATPWLTEYLQICYFMFYLLPIMHAIEMARTGREEAFNEFIRGIVYCYAISYLLYFVMPAVGPRFTLHDFVMTDVDLPGLWLTPALRDIVNQGGGIPAGAGDPLASVNRDCMPSGHTMLTLVNIMLAFRLRSRLRWLFVLIGGSLIVATVYMRYHYVVDVIAGAVLAVVCLPFERVVHTWLLRRIGRA